MSKIKVVFGEPVAEPLAVRDIGARQFFELAEYPEELWLRLSVSNDIGVWGLPIGQPFTRRSLAGGDDAEMEAYNVDVEIVARRSGDAKTKP